MAKKAKRTNWKGLLEAERDDSFSLRNQLGHAIENASRLSGESATLTGTINDQRLALKTAARMLRADAEHFITLGKPMMADDRNAAAVEIERAL